jgi:hypothetical protein
VAQEIQPHPEDEKSDSEIIQVDYMKFPRRYFGSLKDKKAREKQLLKRIRTGSFKPDGFKSKRRSKWTLQFHKVFPGLPFDKKVISKVSGIPVRTLNTVYNRGRRAWLGSSRGTGGTTANQWGTARVYKFVLVTLRKAPKAWYITRRDPDDNLRGKV